MRNITILIAEDERPIRAGLRKMLEDFFAGRPEAIYSILESGNGSDAYRKCLSENVDILITDIRMPAMMGVSLAKRVVRKGLPIHILAVSGYQDYEYVRDMMKLGVYDYLIKPVSQKQLREAMEYFVANLGPPAGSGGGARESEASNEAPGPDELSYDLSDAAAEGFQPADGLARLEEAVLTGDEGGPLWEGVCALFAYYQGRRTPVNGIRKDLSDLSYRLMGRSPDAIEFISKAKFSRFDLTENLDGRSRLSELREHAAECLEHLRVQLSQRRKSRGDATVEKAIAYIESYYASDIQLRQVADHVHLNPNYLSALFHNKTGATFREYVRKVRIDAAKEHIRAGGATAGEIAAMVGYGDTAHFFRAFKSVTGMTPKTYRKYTAPKSK